MEIMCSPIDTCKHYIIYYVPQKLFILLHNKWGNLMTPSTEWKTNTRSSLRTWSRPILAKEESFPYIYSFSTHEYILFISVFQPSSACQATLLAFANVTNHLQMSPPHLVPAHHYGHSTRRVSSTVVCPIQIWKTRGRNCQKREVTVRVHDISSVDFRVLMALFVLCLYEKIILFLFSR